MQLVYEDKYLTLKGVKQGKDDVCLLSFTGVGHAMGGVNVQSEEFVGSSLAQGDVLFITDRTRSWSNCIESDRLKKLFLSWCNSSYNKTVAIGNSMGGTNALILGPMLGAQVVIAFSPQYSVHPEIFPRLESPEWMAWRDRIKTWKYPSVDSASSSEAREYIFHGDTPSEMLHANRFSEKPGRLHLIFEKTGHDVALRLKEEGCLSNLIGCCVRNAPFEEFEFILVNLGIAFRLA